VKVELMQGFFASAPFQGKAYLFFLSDSVTITAKSPAAVNQHYILPMKTVFLDFGKDPLHLTVFFFGQYNSISILYCF
jgi:hypothetical protein